MGHSLLHLSWTQCSCVHMHLCLYMCAMGRRTVWRENIFLIFKIVFIGKIITFSLCHENLYAFFVCFSYLTIFCVLYGEYGSIFCMCYTNSFSCDETSLLVFLSFIDHKAVYYSCTKVFPGGWVEVWQGMCH